MALHFILTGVGWFVAGAVFNHALSDGSTGTWVGFVLCLLLAMNNTRFDIKRAPEWVEE